MPRISNATFNSSSELHCQFLNSKSKCFKSNLININEATREPIMATEMELDCNSAFNGKNLKELVNFSPSMNCHKSNFVHFKAMAKKVNDV